MKRFIITFLLVFTAFSATARAESASFFESASDSATKARVVSLQSPYQVFYPYNDYVDGFDVWVENLGAPGGATFTLRNELGNTLAEKSVTVPTTAFAWGGTRFHVAFQSPVPVSSFEEYRIAVSSAAPNFFLFYSATAELRQHGEATSIDPSLGPAVVGGVSQQFSFKFALYESGDVSAPIISGVGVTPAGADAVRLAFATNERVDRKVVYGAPGGASSTVDFSGAYANCTAYSGGCAVIMNGIVPGKTHYFTLYAKDEWGNVGEAQGSFMTDGGEVVASTSTSSSEDVTPPLISDVHVVEFGGQSATIGWTTNEPANSSVLIARNVAGMPVVTSIGDATYEFSHAISSGQVLSLGMSYIALIISADEAGNYANDAIVFTTAAAPTPTSSPVTLPVTSPTPSSTQEIENLAQQNPPSLVTPPPLGVEISEENGSSSLSVSWEAPDEEPAYGYRIVLFGSAGNIIGYADAPQGARTATFTGVPPGEYSAIAYANRGEVLEKVGAASGLKANPSARGTPFYERKSFYVLSVLVFIAVLALIGIAASRAKRPKQAGFTLVELLIALGVFILVIGFVQLFVFNIFQTTVFFSSTLGTQQEILDTLSAASSEIRTMNQSNTGSYPIEEATTSSFTFFSDVDGDGLLERVRYFVSDTTLKKGIVVPSGNPLAYATSTETVKDVVHDLVATSTPVFSYYGDGFSGTEPPLSSSTPLADIRLVRILLIAEEENQATMQTGPIEDSILIAPRSLRTNL